MRSYLLGISLVALVPVASADDILIRDGAACSIPEGSNVAPFDPLYNPNGMGDFCVFPYIPLKEAVQARLQAESTTLPQELPECEQLSVSPSRGSQTFPCFVVVTE